MSRAWLKAAAESALIGSGVAGLARMRVRRSILILAYHNVVPDDALGFGETSLHLSFTEFCWQLDAVTRCCDVVSLEEVFGTSHGGRPRVVVTFDDAYRGAVSLALPELAKRGLPATVFVPAGLVGQGEFWWDAVADANGGTIAPGLRDDLLHGKAGRADRIREWASATWSLRSLPDSYLPASETELSHSLRNANIVLGGHTWSHPNLAALSTVAVEEELLRSKAWLEDRFGEHTLPWLSYPYGLENGTVRTAAREAGYRAAVCIEGGWVAPDHHEWYAVPRVNISSRLSRRGFALRLAGLVRR